VAGEKPMAWKPKGFEKGNPKEATPSLSLIKGGQEKNLKSGGAVSTSPDVKVSPSRQAIKSAVEKKSKADGTTSLIGRASVAQTNKSGLAAQQIKNNIKSAPQRTEGHTTRQISANRALGRTDGLPPKRQALTPVSEKIQTKGGVTSNSSNSLPSASTLGFRRIKETGFTNG